MENTIVGLSLVHYPVINFAMQQNHVPLIRSMVVNNLSENDLSEIELVITVDPEIAAPFIRKIDYIPKGEGLDLGTINLILTAQYLRELTEQISGTLSVVIKDKKQEYFSETYTIDFLAYDQWSGLQIMPEVLAAFVTPNHPIIAPIIRRASEILNDWTENPSFDEYQSKNPNRIRKQMAAIYEAIAEQKIIYCSTPASFGQSGQRVRLCDTVLIHKMGNCLDLSLLYASCLESVGLHPLIITIKGHAFAGVWLTEETFPDSVNDDASLLSKRIAEGINEITIIESTCMNAGQNRTFDEASNIARQHLKSDENFYLFIDIKRSRFGGIRPLPQIVNGTFGNELSDEKITPKTIERPKELVDSQNIFDSTQTEVSKQRIWERKLLDLSLRNNLLNIRITKRTMQLLTVDLGLMEDTLANGEEFQIMPMPNDWDNPLRSSGIYKTINSTDPILDLIKQELIQKRIRTYLNEEELAPALIHLYRSSRLSIEENGANTLYLALGLLKWYESPNSERPRFAPIILLPVEMVRKSAQKGYVVRSREEEPVLNITLLEMLRQDFGICIKGLNPLPVDESGINVRLILNTIRKSIMLQKRWDVEEQAMLGTFSFNKFIMWSDIRNNSASLSENKIVYSLITGKIEWDLKKSEDIINLDNRHPSDIVLPIIADSSQMEAICSAVNDESFVLHGPPGTGKSQTITNIIANALYKGKRVLFVAEKMAALSVVQKRLEDIGLAPFCLELHSNKAQKSSVLEQLKTAIEVSKKASSEEFSQEAERIFLLRKELNEYVDILHKKYPFGFSLYDAFTGYAHYIENPDIISFTDRIDKLSKEQLEKWIEILEEIKTAAQIASPSTDHPWAGVKIDQFSPLVKEKISNKLQSIILAIDMQQKLEKPIRKLLNELLPVETEKDARHHYEFINLLLGIKDYPLNLLYSDNLKEDVAVILDLVEHGKKRDHLKKDLLQNFTDSAFDMHAEVERLAWLQAENKWFIAKWLQQNKILKRISIHAKNGKVDKVNILHNLDDLISHQKESGFIKEQTEFYFKTLGRLWKNGKCDWSEVTDLCAEIIRVNQTILSISNSVSIAKQLKSIVIDNLSVGKDTFISVNGKVLSEYVHAFENTDNQIKELKNLLKTDEKIDVEIDNWLCFWQKKCIQWSDSIDLLKNWCVWNTINKKATELNISDLIVLIENKSLNVGNLFGAFHKSLYRSCANFILAQEPLLANFNGTFFEGKIRKFKKLCKQFEKLTQKEIYARLASRIPISSQDAAQSSEIGILLRNIRNNGRATPIRKLFDSIPNLLFRTSPCMLMSPISVAQYLDISNQKFDLVIFDEASQMPTSEAVGAIARGKNVIVVGDPKQMPPTSFFSSNYVDEENIEMEDLESILDDCLALSMPSKYLLWHYRSKHESLISFSNAQFYDNKLLTFPSPDDLSSKVSFVSIEGYYDKGKSRQNMKEAESIVGEIERRLTDPKLSKFSIGVVTFSSAQQSLIDDLLNERFKTDPELETAALDRHEPLFIKNLENVQGDERDIILFSIGYGPDQNGKISLNFGPLNREGGWRRLNVAVSRARYEMIIYSTLHADQIDPNRTSSEGVMGLKAFLNFAEKGQCAIIPKKQNTNLRASDFENMVARALEEKGFKVHTNIGFSGYRVDLGIVNPTNPSEYVLGILCDGQNYRSARTALDREVVQRNALSMLGWNIYQIWSTDWWTNPEAILNGVLEYIKQILEMKVESEKTEKEIPVFLPTVNESLKSLSPKIEPLEMSNPFDEKRRIYVMSQLDYVSHHPDDILFYGYIQMLCDQVQSVIQIEAPISKELICKRVLSAWGISRLGSRINTHFEKNIFPILNLISTPSNTGKYFYWNQEQNPTTYDMYRWAENDGTKRDADDISPEEASNAVYSILKQQISLIEDDLSKETARLFGYTRSGGNVENSMKRGIQKAIDRGLAKNEGGRIVLID